MDITTQTLEQRIRHLEDLEAIRDLKHQYCHLADRGYEGAGEGFDELADLFVEDGIFHPSLEYPRIGRKAIAENCRTFFPLGCHMAINPSIQVDGDRASGTWWGLIALGTGTEAYWIAGRYHDEFVRMSEGWRFAKLYFATAFFTPYNEGWGKARFFEGQ